MTSPYTAAGGTEENDPTPSNTTVYRAVDQLAATLNDGVRGLEAAAEATEGDLAERFRSMADQRRSRVADLKAMADDEGVEAERLDTDGTLGGKLHSAWIGVKDSTSGDDGVVESAASGERHAREDLTDLVEGELPDPFTKVARSAISDIDANLAELDDSD